MQQGGGRGFFWDSEDLAKQAVNHHNRYSNSRHRFCYKKLPGGKSIVNPLSGKDIQQKK